MYWKIKKETIKSWDLDIEVSHAVYKTINGGSIKNIFDMSMFKAASARLDTSWLQS